MAEKKDTPKKRPTAEKRVLQNEKRRLINKAFKSKMRTTVRNFETTLKKGEAEEIKTGLKEIYSLADKGVKRGIHKLNTASRIKSRYTAKAQVKLV
jgi:small subunit ribosomal protein S20